MKWWYRFWFGLPARDEDIEELKEILPELWDSNWQVDATRLRRLFPDPDLWLWAESPSYILKQLRKWSSDALTLDEPLSHKSTIKRDSSVESCPLPECPLGKYKKPDQEVQPHPEELEVFHDRFRLMCAGGGPNRNVPKAEFFDLVRKVHQGTKQIREVILTDRYIYKDVGEDGRGGGFNNLLGYLETLRLVKDSQFIMKLNPSPKNTTERDKQLFRRVIAEAFPNITFQNFSPKYVFHDRFYLVRDDTGQIKGVFGPSVNGLASNTIALMGELEQKQALERLSEWLG